MTKPGERLRTWPEMWALLLLFLLALGLRLLFWQATPDSAAPYPGYYKGDAPSWLAYAGALRDSKLFELGLPLRPPGVGYLLALGGTVKKRAFRRSASCGACWAP